MPLSLSSKPWFATATCFGCWIFALFSLFAWTLSDEQQFAYRDAAHYYRPLWMQVQDQIGDGHLPLLSPEERGRPLLADPTAATFYPPKLVFALPGTFESNFKRFIVGHVLLCFITTFVAARRFNLHWTCALFASITYTLGGSVVFQTCNVPYLIGAAWLPLGLAAAYQVVTRARTGAVLELATVLAMLVLGGDVQTALLLGVSSILLLTLGLFNLAKLSVGSKLRSGVRSGYLLVSAGLLGAGLAIVQWLPTAEWASESERPALQANAPNMFDVAASDPRLRFSVGPWRWAELAWPNLSGRPFPIHTRWLSAVPAEGRLWTPTLYMSLLVPLFAWSAIRFRGGRLSQRWFSWLLAFGLLGSLGRFGIGWIMNELNGAAPGPIRDEVGGLYWLLTRLLPGFSLFRYPAKLWTWAALALSLLAATRLHDVLQQRLKPLQERALLTLAGCATMLIFVVLLITAVTDYVPRWEHLLPKADALYGPFAVPTARQQLIECLLHGWLVTGTVLLIMRTRRGISQQAIVALLCIVATVDLSLAHRWLQPSAPMTAFQNVPDVPSDSIVHRAKLQAWYPSEWSQTNAQQRIVECIQWDQQSLRAKHPLAKRIGSLCGYTSFSTLSQRALQELLEALHTNDAPYLPELLAELGVNAYATPSVASSSKLPNEHDHPMRRDPIANSYEIRLLKNPNPTVWIPQRVATVPIDTAPDPVHDSIDTWSVALRHLLVNEDATRANDLEESSTIFSDRAAQVQPANGTVRYLQRAPHELSISIDLPTAGWIIINRSPCKGWTAHSTASSDALDIARANGVMMGIYAPRGKQEIYLRYEPNSLRPSAAISSLSLIMLLVASTLTWKRRVAIV